LENISVASISITLPLFFKKSTFFFKKSTFFIVFFPGAMSVRLALVRSSHATPSPAVELTRATTREDGMRGGDTW
jgi:hypothetical protein